MLAIHCGVTQLSQPQPELATARPSFRTSLLYESGIWKPCIAKMQHAYSPR
ncbi:hypothetical protein M3J09_004472 [Ascochyta lentis]